MKRVLAYILILNGLSTTGFLAAADSRDLKGWDAKRQQDDAEQIQNAQAMAKTIIKQGKELERMTTMDPGRKAQLTQEINRLQYEISKHLEQGQALQDTAQKAEFAAKQAEAGNAKKGSQLDTQKLESVASDTEAKEAEEGAASAKASESEDARGDVANVLPENAALAAERAFSSRETNSTVEETAQVGFNDEVKEVPSQLDAPKKSKEEIVSTAQAAFAEKLNKLSAPAPSSLSSATLDNEIKLSQDVPTELSTEVDTKKELRVAASVTSTPSSKLKSGNSLLELLRDRVASATAELSAMQASFGLAGLSALPNASRAQEFPVRALASTPTEMRLTGVVPVNPSDRLIAGSNRVQRNRRPTPEPEAL